MAYDYYQGNDGEWENANFESGFIPIGNDDVAVPKTVDVNINGTDQTGVLLGTLRFSPEFAGNIGASGDPLKIDCQLVRHEGSGTLYYESSQDVAEVTQWCVINSPNMDLAAVIDGSQVNHITVASGAVTLPASLGSVNEPERIDIVGPAGGTRFAKVTINCDIVVATGVLVVSGGQSVLQTVGLNLASLYQSGGLLWVDNPIIAHAFLTGGILYFNTASTLGNAHVYGGTLDLCNNRREKTVTNLFLYRGGTLIWDPELHTITNLHNFGGLILGPDASGQRRRFSEV